MDNSSVEQSTAAFLSGGFRAILSGTADSRIVRAQQWAPIGHCLSLKLARTMRRAALPPKGPLSPISQLAPRLSPQQWGLLFSGDQEATSGRILTRAAMGFLISFEVTRS